MSLVGFQAQNHPQQVGARGKNRHDILPGFRDLFQAAPDEVTDDVDDRALPAEIFSEWNARFHFTVDVAANTHNAKLDRFYSALNSGLDASWRDERVYCNPPFSNIRPWVEKAWVEEGAPLIVMLLPANRTEQKWWQDLVEPKRDRPDSILRSEMLPGRLKFLSPGQDSIQPNNRPPFGCCLLIWNRDI